MKKSIKILSFIFIFTIFIGAIPTLSIYAENEPSLVVEVSDDSPVAGDEITVTVKLKNNPGVWSLAFEMPIDTKVFEFVSAETSSSIFNQFGMCGYDDIAASYKFNAFHSDLFNNLTNDGILAVITLKIKDNVSADTYYISCIPNTGNTINVEEQLVTLSLGAHPVTIKESLPEPESKIVAANVVLGKTVDVNYYAKLDASHSAAQMRFTVNGKEIIINGIPSADYSGEYVYSLNDIEYKEYDSNIKAELILGGQVLDVREEYSVKAYCERMQNKNAEEIGISTAQHASLKKLLSSLISYGECIKSSTNANEIKASAANYRVALNDYAGK